MGPLISPDSMHEGGRTIFAIRACLPQPFILIFMLSSCSEYGCGLFIQLDKRDQGFFREKAFSIGFSRKLR